MKKKEMRVSATERLYSLDALRGFDMFILVGGASLIVSLIQLTGILCIVLAGLPDLCENTAIYLINLAGLD